jgi:hypothetical protein
MKPRVVNSHNENPYESDLSALVALLLMGCTSDFGVGIFLPVLYVNNRNLSMEIPFGR